MKGFTESMFGFDHPAGDAEVDANVALTELDKGLRSAKLGEQTEAIVRFPVLFERYPFPILINTGFMKLADVFRSGSNFIRLLVLRVCQQSERHLEKILTIDEFIRRIFSVFHSNDPIARALTLRTLGSLAALIPERKPVHHSIRFALDSHDRVEVSAAIYTAICFAKKSKTFGVTMCTKVSSMVQRLSTPIDLKLRLIPIFQHMHHDVATASIVRKLCLELLQNYPSEEFVITILHTLTHLAAATISDLTDQVSFLLQNLSDSRPQVKLNVMNDLNYLAEKGGHLWIPEHITKLVNTVLSFSSERMETDEYDYVDVHIVYTTLDIIKSVTSLSPVLSFLYSNDSPLWTLIESSIRSSDKKIALKAIQISTCITINWKNEKDMNTGLVDLAISGVESFLKYYASMDEIDMNPDEIDEYYKSLEKCLSYGVQLCKASPVKSQWFIDIMLLLLKSNSTTAQGRNLVSQSIGSIGAYNIEAVQSSISSILHILESWNESQISLESTTCVVLVAVLLQAHQGHSIDKRTLNCIKKIINSDIWNAYRVARNSLRYGQPEIAELALEGTSLKVASETFHFWLTSLYSVSKAESILASDSEPRLLNRLSNASKIYVQSVASLKAACSSTVSLTFQIEFVRIRSEMLISFMNLFLYSNSMMFSPPPAIANTISQASRDELLKSGRVVTQLRKSIREFQAINDMYGQLYQTAFDADNETLYTIQILKQICLLVVRAIEKLVISKDHPSFSDDDSPFNFCLECNYKDAGNSWTLLQSAAQAVKILQGIKKTTPQIVTLEQIDCLKEAMSILIETPISYPRFFFQTIQNTRIKISVSPQPKQPEESVTVLAGNNLALKVEGVIQQSGKKKGSTLFRKPKSIRIIVALNPLANQRNNHSEMTKGNQETQSVVKEVSPHKDFFEAQFLLAPSPGMTNVTVDTSIVDQEGRQWMTGLRLSVPVRVFDESGSKSSSATSSARLNIPNQAGQGMRF